MRDLRFPQQNTLHTEDGVSKKCPPKHRYPTATPHSVKHRRPWRESSFHKSLPSQTLSWTHSMQFISSVFRAALHQNWYNRVNVAE